MSGAKSVAFMNNKSWHTGTFKHMELVWKAEMVAEEEKKKLELVKKELAEEREIEELRRAHEDATGKKRLEKVDFLYQTPLQAGPSAEDYLLGTKFQEDKKQTDIHTVASKPGSLFLETLVDAQSDVRNKVREDPLFAMKQKEIEARTQVMNNPIKMKKLREEVLKAKLRKELKKKEKKKRKREKDGDRKRERSAERSGERSKDGHGERERGHIERDGYERKRRREGEREEERDVKRARRESPSPPRERYERSRGPRRSLSPRREREERHERPREREREPRRDERRDERRDSRRERSLSPPRRHNGRRRSASPPRKSSTTSSSRRQMTDEERAAKLAEMEANAAEHEQKRNELLALVRESEANETEEVDESKRGALAPSFVTEFGKSVYNDKAGAGSIEDRIKRARFTSQRKNLDERGLF